MAKTFIKKVTDFFRDMFRLYLRLDVFNLSAALAFYTIVSILPIFMLLFSGAGHYLERFDNILAEIQSFLNTINPQLSIVFQGNLLSLTKKTGAVGGLSLLLTIVVANFLFSHLEMTVNRILGVREKRHYLLQRIIFLLWLVLICVLILVPIILNFVLRLLQRQGFEIPYYWSMSGDGVFVVSILIGFVTMMHLLPNRKIYFSDTLPGGLMVAGLLLVAKYVFGFYTGQVIHRYNLIYGSLTALMFSTIWVFYFYNIVLLGAVWVRRRQLIRRRAEQQKVIPSLVPSPLEGEGQGEG